MSSDLDLVDGAGHVIAQLENTSFTPFKLGKIHLSEKVEQEVMDLAVVTCIAMIEKRRRAVDAPLPPAPAA